MKKIKIAPSVLSANFSNLQDQISAVEKGGADWIHLDIMDGHFVPNITFGPVVVRAIRKCTKLPLDAHLMIESPDRYLENFREAGVNRLTVHVEACTHLHRTIQKIKELGMNAGVSLNPATHASSIAEILPFVDQILVMTVNPGFGGQKFIESTLKKIEKISSMIGQLEGNIELEVDGGVDTKNAHHLVDAGVTVLVAGNSIFSQKNISQAVKHLRIAAIHP
jgi:ribulose-phosphate 3-epimerase